jgi:Family of unknown function (DUF6512)
LVRRTNVLVIELIGTIFIVFLGSALHFTYALSGNNPVVGCFSAVNESVWEHLKLAFWPSLFWMLIAMFPLRKVVSNFFSAKTFGAYIMVIIIPAVFYFYTTLTGESIFTVDIATFVAAVIIGQFVSYRIFKYGKYAWSKERIAIAAMVVLAAVFILFTFFPPHLPIFQDSNTGQYGV